MRRPPMADIDFTTVLCMLMLCCWRAAAHHRCVEDGDRDGAEEGCRATDLPPQCRKDQTQLKSRLNDYAGQEQSY